MQRPSFKLYRNWFLFSLVATAVAAFFSSGYHHPDEYMQIVEFAFSKITGDANHLPWEYVERMRPWFQPGTFYILIRFADLVGLKDPFLIISLFRLLLGLLGWISLVLVAKVLLSRPEGHRREVAVAVAGLLFVFPWFFTRTSSESLAGSLLATGLALVLLGKGKLIPKTGESYSDKTLCWLLSGLLIGFAFLSRFQIGVLAIPLAVWLVAIARVKKRFIFVFVASGLTVATLGFFIDSWGYGQPTLAPWNYLYQNVVLNKSAQWGVSPFWQYGLLIHNHVMPLLSIPLFLLWISSLRNVWSLPSLIVITFVLVHSLIGHKELRFIFPILPLLPLLVYDGFVGRLGGWLWRWRQPFFALNLIVLVFVSVWPSRTEVLVQKWLWRELPESSSLYWDGKNPYVLGDHPIFFVRPRGTEILPLNDLAPEQQKRSHWIVTSRAHLFVPQSGCKKRWQLFPSWIEAWNPIRGQDWLGKSGHWAVFECSAD